MSFEPAKAKLTIGSLDTGIQVSAQYNPKELQIERPVPWGKHQFANKSQEQKDGVIRLEFTGAESRTMTVEMMFDQFEKKLSVAGQVGLLEQMASVIDPGSDDENRRRPHHCVVLWGQAGLPSFKCVITQLTTKYTMFDTNGLPLRATCTVQLKEADQLALAASAGGTSTDGPGAAGGGGDSGGGDSGGDDGGGDDGGGDDGE
jgi:uncharacterized membrane protein YgcG